MAARGCEGGWRGSSEGWGGANEFAATTTRSPPSRTTGRVRRRVGWRDGIWRRSPRRRTVCRCSGRHRGRLSRSRSRFLMSNTNVRHKHNVSLGMQGGQPVRQLPQARPQSVLDEARGFGRYHGIAARDGGGSSSRVISRLLARTGLDASAEGVCWPRTWARKSTPSTSSMVKNQNAPSAISSPRSTRLGWCRPCSARNSRLNRASESASLWASTFSARRAWRSRSSASNTTPLPPWPRCRSSWNRAVPVKLAKAAFAGDGATAGPGTISAPVACAGGARRKRPGVPAACPGPCPAGARPWSGCPRTPPARGGFAGAPPDRRRQWLLAR